MPPHRSNVWQVAQSMLVELNWAPLLADRSLLSAGEDILKIPGPSSLPLVSRHAVGLANVQAVLLSDSIFDCEIF